MPYPTARRARTHSPILLLDDGAMMRRWLTLVLVQDRRVVLSFDRADRLLRYLAGATAPPAAVIADQRALGSALATLTARLGGTSDRPRLLLIGDPDRPLFVPALRELGVADVLVPPLDRHDVTAAIAAIVDPPLRFAA